MALFSLRKHTKSTFIQVKGNVFSIQINVTYKLGVNILDYRKFPIFNTPRFLPEVSRCSWHGKRKRLPETRKVINKNLGWLKRWSKRAGRSTATSNDFTCLALRWEQMEPRWVIKRHPGLTGICRANGREGTEREREIENATLLCFMEGFGQWGTGLVVRPKAML